MEGESARYLGFPIGSGLSPKDIDAKIMMQVKSKLNACARKHLSLAARILVCNQVILASIWYFASCSNVSSSVLLRVKTLVRNFMWGGNPDRRTRARLAWDTAIAPTMRGGLRIFDPLTQTRALLAKMIPQAVSPGAEPWKALRRDGD